MNFSILASLMLAAVSPAFVNHNSMKGSVKVMTNQVEWAQKVEDKIAEKRYALFIIPATAEFPDFELKASNNNYAKADGEAEPFCPFYASSTFNGNTTWKGDAFRLYACYSKLNSDGDARRWRRILNTIDRGVASLDLPATAFAVIVDPALLGRDQGDAWLSDANDELVWNYLRISNSHPETEVEDDDTSPWLWRPIMPVRWYSKLPAWANQEPYPAE